MLSDLTVTVHTKGISKSEKQNGINIRYSISDYFARLFEPITNKKPFKI